MTALISLLKNSLFVSIVGMAAIVILIWVVGPLIAIAGIKPLEGMVARLGVICFIACIWLIKNLIQQQKIKRANSDFSRSFTTSSEFKQKELTPSDKEVAMLGGKFEEALRLLQSSMSYRGRFNLYEIPWYLIIGPPGSGKTTALANSDLRFPLADKLGEQAIKGVGGTRNCDWWFTEAAVLIDTAGRYTSQDSDHNTDAAGWRGFLTLLIKYRKRRPINGLLVAISIQDLLMQSEAQRREQVSKIRNRLQELNQELQLRFPIYVIFTKCDLVSGFMEFFEDLSLEERRQVWGITFPFSKKQPSTAGLEIFSKEYDLLMKRLQARVFQRLQNERDPGRATKIFSFPQQMVSLKSHIEYYLSEIFAESRYGMEGNLFRGCYLTSATQEGTPIDRVIGSVSRSFGIDQDVVAPRAQQGRAYFMNHLLNKVVFRESEIVGVNRRFETQRKIIQKTAYGMAGALTILSIFGWTTSFAKNQQYVYKSKNKLDQYQLIRNKGSSEIISRLEILDAAKSLSNLNQSFENGRPFAMGMGLFQGDKMSRKGIEVYKHELKRLLIPELKHSLTRSLEGSYEDLFERYLALRAYLTFVGENPGANEKSFSRWTLASLDYELTDDSSILGSIEQHFLEMVRLGVRPEKKSYDSELVARVRAELAEIEPDDLYYEIIKYDFPDDDIRNITSQSILGSNAKKVFTDDSGNRLQSYLPGMFSKAGYFQYFRGQLKNLASTIESESWVLGATVKNLNEREIVEIKRDIEEKYFYKYAEAWDKKLGSIQVADIKNSEEMVEVLKILSSPSSSPIKHALMEVQEHSNLASATRGSKLRGSKVFDKMSKRLGKKSPKLSSENKPIDIVRDHFKPLTKLVEVDQEQESSAPIDNTLQLLESLHEVYKVTVSGLYKNSSLLVDNKSQIELKLRDLDVNAIDQPQPVKRWLQQIASAAVSINRGDVKTAINRAWKEDVLPLCKKVVNGNYPFHSNTSKDATLRDFGDLFSPGGKIDLFYKSKIKPNVASQGKIWHPSHRTIRSFQQAAIIRDTYFYTGGNRPSVTFKVLPKGMNENRLILDLEGQYLRYRNVKKFRGSVTWPNEEKRAKHGVARLIYDRFGPLDNNKVIAEVDSYWAVFRLFDKARTTATTGNIVELTYTVNDRDITFLVKADSAVNPFNKKVLQEFTCLEEL